MLGFEGRRYLVTGVLNDGSIAWHTAEALQEAGAEVLLTGFGRTRRITEAAAAGLPRPTDVLNSMSPGRVISSGWPVTLGTGGARSTASCTRSPPPRSPR